MKNFFNKMGIWILAAAVVIVLTLSILSATGTGLLDNIAGTIASPFRSAGAAIGNWVGSISDKFDDVDTLQKENEELKKRIAELEEANGVLELQRSDLAQRFGCVPSQINYVMSTRFSPEHGYIVESRRGGGGYIRIRRVQMDRQTLLMHVINSIGGELDGRSARAILTNLAQSEAVAPAAAQTALCALSDSALRTVPKDRRDALRADILKQILIHLV